MWASIATYSFKPEWQAVKLTLFAPLHVSAVKLKKTELLVLQASTTRVTFTAGEKAKMVYKARTKELTLTVLEFGQWTYNEVVIVSNSYFVIGNNTTTRKFWLEIREVDVSKSGSYSFVVNGTAVRRWELQVKSGIENHNTCM